MCKSIIQYIRVFEERLCFNLGHYASSVQTRNDTRKKIYVLLSVIVVRYTVRSSKPPLCCFQGTEKFLFWDNNTNYKKQQQKM